MPVTLAMRAIVVFAFALLLSILDMVLCVVFFRSFYKGWMPALVLAGSLTLLVSSCVRGEFRALRAWWHPLLRGQRRRIVGRLVQLTLLLLTTLPTLRIMVEHGIKPSFSGCLVAAAGGGWFLVCTEFLREKKPGYL